MTQEIFIDNSTTSKTLNNIKKSLKDNLITKYNINDENIINKILQVHGLSKNNFDFVSMVEQLLSKRLNDISIDDNSNKNETTIEGMFSEVAAPVKKAVGYDYLHRQIKNLYGKKEADRLIGEMIDYSIALSDSSNILKVYCYSLDASKIVTLGRDFGVLHSKPSKRVSSYISALCETIHQLSSHLAGAIAVGTFFLDIAHLLMYKENVSYDDLFTKTYRKYIENEMQQFVHSVNHLSRNGQESPFTNVSIFDRAKLKSFLDQDNYGWYFPNNTSWNDNITQDEIIEYILEIQNIYLEFFDKGDPSQNGLPYRFPVTTVNIAKDETGNIMDPKFVKDICQRDIFRYNIFTSEGTKIASCCFGGSEIIKIQNSEGQIKLISLQDYVDSYIGDNEEQKITTNDQILDIDGNYQNIVGVLKKKNHTGKLIKISVDDNTSSVTPDHIFKVYDVVDDCEKIIAAYEILKNSGRYMIPIKTNSGAQIRIISDIEQIDHNGYVYDIEMEDNHFFAANGIYSHNCRLISNIELLELASQANSFAGGSSVSLGSHRVCTLNYMRIALESKSFDEFMNTLTNRIEDAGKILKAHKQLISTLADNGLQQFIANGWINPKRLFSTWGILGIPESIKYIKENYDVTDDVDICKIILEHTNKTVTEFSKNNDLIGNIEQIPAESMAHRLPTVDKLLFGEENVPYVLYTNQFIPLWEEKSIYERLIEDGKYNALITGGGIVHCNVDGKITPKQAEHIIKFAISTGCEHFAINAVYSKCEKGHVSIGKINCCPMCGSQIVDRLTRVVGFLTPVSSWNAPRREWEFDKRFVEKVTTDQYI